MNKNTMKSTPIDETTAIKLKISQDKTQEEMKTFKVSKKSEKNWINSALRVARYVAASALVLGSLSTVALAQESASILPLASEFDGSLVVLTSSTDKAQLHRPHKNTTLNPGLVISLYESRQRALKREFYSGKISLQKHLNDLEDLEVGIGALYDELDIRVHGKITGDNRPKAREKRQQEAIEKNKRTMQKLFDSISIQKLFDSISSSVRSFLSSSDQKGVKNVAHLIHLAAIENLSEASLSKATSVVNNISEASELLLRQSDQHQVAMSEDGVDVFKRLLTQPPAFSQGGTPNKKDLIETIEKRIAFNEKIGMDLSKGQKAFEESLSALKNSALRNSESNDFTVQSVFPLLNASSMQSALFDLTTSIANSSKTNIENNYTLNSLLKEISTAIEADDILAIDEINIELSALLSKDDLETIQRYADGLALQEDKSFHSDHSSFSMN